MKRSLLLLLWSTFVLYATPVTYNNSGLVTDLEKFVKSCDYYKSVFKHPSKVNMLCNTYDHKLKEVLRMGYRLDSTLIPSEKHTHMYNGKMHTCTEQGHHYTTENKALLKKYRSKLFKLDDLRKQIIELAREEKVKARSSYDVSYHEKLIRNRDVPLYHDDYVFMAEHKEIYEKTNNSRYRHMQEKKLSEQK